MLLQARNPGDSAREDEHRAFAARLGVPLEAVRAVDVLSERLDAGVLDGADALLVGGAGEYSVVHPVPPVQALIDFLAWAATEGPVPVFASCFGFQALVVGFGGSVVEDEANAEVGTYWLERTEAAADDELFGALPPRFRAQLGHRDRAERLPGGLVVLARSERAPVQAVRVPGRAAWATQFHPELTAEDNRARFLRYMDTYGRLFGEAEARRRLEEHRPSPEANALLGRFAREVVGVGR